MPCARPTLFLRLPPPSFRSPTARKSTPCARPNQEGSEIEHNRYVTTTAITATWVFSWLRGRLPVLSHRGGEDPRDGRLRGRRRPGDQRRLPARAVPRARRAAEARSKALRPRRRDSWWKAAAGGRVTRQGNVGEDFRLVVNNGDQAGQTLPHLHLHVLARREFAWPPG